MSVWDSDADGESSSLLEKLSLSICLLPFADAFSDASSSICMEMPNISIRDWYGKKQTGAKSEDEQARKKKTGEYSLHLVEFAQSARIANKSNEFISLMDQNGKHSVRDGYGEQQAVKETSWLAAMASNKIRDGTEEDYKTCVWWLWQARSCIAGNARQRRSLASCAWEIMKYWKANKTMEYLCDGYGEQRALWSTLIEWMREKCRWFNKKVHTVNHKRCVPGHRQCAADGCLVSISHGRYT